MKNVIYLIIVLFVFVACNDELTNDNTDNVTEHYYLLKTDFNIDSGSYVLAPSKSSYDTALVNGLEYALFVFYPRIVMSQMPDSVKIDELGDTVVLPSSLIIPMQNNVKAYKGDMVLTWWQTGTGMQRAIVLSKDSTLTPVVYYIDNQYSLFSSANDINFWIDTLAPNSFLIIKDRIMSGRSMMVEEEYYTTFYTVINVGQEKILGLNWAGTLNVFNKDEVKIIPLNTSFNVGDSVFVPYYGSYCSGTVKAVWNDIGKLTVDVLFIDEHIETYANMMDTYKFEKK